MIKFLIKNVTFFICLWSCILCGMGHWTHLPVIFKRLPCAICLRSPAAVLPYMDVCWSDHRNNRYLIIIGLCPYQYVEFKVKWYQENGQASEFSYHTCVCISIDKTKLLNPNIYCLVTSVLIIAFVISISACKFIGNHSNSGETVTYSLLDAISQLWYTQFCIGYQIYLERNLKQVYTVTVT